MHQKVRSFYKCGTIFSLVKKTVKLFGTVIEFVKLRPDVGLRVKICVTFDQEFQTFDRLNGVVTSCSSTLVTSVYVSCFVLGSGLYLSDFSMIFPPHKNCKN